MATMESSNSTYGHISREESQFKKIHAPQCSPQRYLQQSGHGSNLKSVDRWTDKEDVGCVCVYLCMCVCINIYTHTHIYMNII